MLQNSAWLLCFMDGNCSQRWVPRSSHSSSNVLLLKTGLFVPHCDPLADTPPCSRWYLKPLCCSQPFPPFLSRCSRHGTWNIQVRFYPPPQLTEQALSELCPSIPLHSPGFRGRPMRKQTGFFKQKAIKKTTVSEEQTGLGKGFNVVWSLRSVSNVSIIWW